MAGLFKKILSAIPTIIDVGSGLAKSIRDKAKLKKAIETANAGGELTAYQLDLMKKAGYQNSYLNKSLATTVDELPTEYKIIGLGLIFGLIFLITRLLQR
jgi:hypothetical protein